MVVIEYLKIFQSKSYICNIIVVLTLFVVDSEGFLQFFLQSFLLIYKKLKQLFQKNLTIWNQ